MKALFFTVLSILTFKACSEDPGDQDPLKLVLSDEDPYIQQVMDRVEEHELQIIYTRIERQDDSLLLRDYQFEVNKENYFYKDCVMKREAIKPC